MIRLYVFVLAFLSSIGISFGSETVTIFYQNDLHGWFYPSTQEAGLPKVYEILRAEEAKKTLNFYVAAGDILTGPPLPEDQKGKMEIGIWGLFQKELDNLGLKDRHMLSLGNHEFDYGFVEELKVLRPVTANIVDKGSNPVFEPFRMYKGSDLSFAFIGLIMADYPKLNSVLSEKGYEVQDPKKALKRYETEICKADITAIVIHDSISNIKELVESLPENNCIDIIISGHSHIITDKPIYIKNKPLVQAGSMNQYIGRATFKVDKGKAELIENTLIPLYPDRFTFELMKMKEIVSEQKGKSIAIIKSSLLKPKQKPPNDSTLGCFIADAIRWKSNTDIAIVNNDSLRKEFYVKHEPLPLRQGDVREIYPFKNKVVIGTIKGSELIKFVEAELMDFKNQFSGLSYTFTTKDTLRLEEIKVNGQPISKEKLYSISMPSYVLKPENIKEILHGVIISSTKELPFYVDDAVIDYASHLKTVSYPEKPGRITERR